MRAVILAAGIGKRLKEYTKDKPKCMVEVGGVPLIERLLHQILRYGNLEHIIIVVGYLDHVLKDCIAGLNLPACVRVDYVFNAKYHYANNIYSLYCAREYFDEDIVLFESDLVFEDLVIEQVFRSPFDNCVLVSSYCPWMDGSVVRLMGDRVESIVFKEEFTFKHDAKYYKTANVYRFSKEFLRDLYLPILQNYVRQDNIAVYYERALRDVLSSGGCLHAEIIESDLWYEIDNPNDFVIANLYFPHQNPAALGKNYGGYWRFPKIEDYCLLVNPYFPNAKLLDELKEMLNALVASYPSGAKMLQRLAATMLEIDPRFTQVGNGASELILALMETLGGRVGSVVPTFEYYLTCHKFHVASLAVRENDFIYSAEDLIAFIIRESISTILLVAPDNPSGFLLPQKDLEEVLQWTKAHGVYVVLDESFMDFAEECYTCLTNAKLVAYPNLIVIKSISKSYGVAGLRIGILASSNVGILESISNKSPIWNINSIAEYFLQSIVKYKKDYKESCKQLINARKAFIKRLREIEEIEVFDSQGNYVLCMIKDPNICVYELADFCLENHFLIKDCSNKIGLERGFFRLAVRKDGLNAVLVGVIERFFKER